MEGFIVLKPLGDRVVLKVEKEKEESNSVGARRGSI